MMHHISAKTFQRQIVQCRESRSCMLKSLSIGALVATCPGASEMPLPAGKGLKNICGNCLKSPAFTLKDSQLLSLRFTRNKYVNLQTTYYADTVVKQTTSLLTLEGHAVQALLFVKALQAPQAMSSETQHACWRIWWWRRWTSIRQAQKEIRWATRPAFAGGCRSEIGF